MKKLLYIVLVALTFGIAGCTEDPAEVANKIGKATGLAAELALDQKTMDAACDIIKQVNEAAELFATKDVSEVINTIVSEYIKEGKIDEATGALLMKLGKALAIGLDYLFQKHPDWKQDADTLIKVVNGFCEGVLSVVCTDCKDCKVLSAPADFDKDAYDFVKSGL